MIPALIPSIATVGDRARQVLDTARRSYRVARRLGTIVALTPVVLGMGAVAIAPALDDAWEHPAPPAAD